jgi:hypothetical protein
MTVFNKKLSVLAWTTIRVTDKSHGIWACDLNVRYIHEVHNRRHHGNFSPRTQGYYIEEQCNIVIITFTYGVNTHNYLDFRVE